MINEELLRVNELEEKEETKGCCNPLCKEEEDYKHTKDVLKDRFEERTKETKEFLKDSGVKPIKGILDESLFEDLDNNEQDDNIYYKDKRDCLFDIINDELSIGERVYKIGVNNKLVPTKVNGLHVDPELIGIGYDMDYIKAYVDDNQLKGAVSMANKYQRKYEIGEDQFVKGNGKFIKIFLNDEDFYEPFFDPNVKTIKDYKG